MEAVEFDKNEDASAYLAGFLATRLSDSSVSSGSIPLLAQDLLSVWAVPVETVRPPNVRPAHIAGLKWVIRDEDLKVLDSILDGVKASAGAGFFAMAGITAVPHVVAGVGITAAFLKLAYNAVTKGVRLSPEDYSILATVIGKPSGLLAEEIYDRLAKVEPNWTVEAISQRLTSLTEIPNKSGKIALVWKSADNRWRTTGV